MPSWSQRAISAFETIGLDNFLENLNDLSRANIIILDACSQQIRLRHDRSRAIDHNLVGSCRLFQPRNRHFDRVFDRARRGGG